MPFNFNIHFHPVIALEFFIVVCVVLSALIIYEYFDLNRKAKP